MKKKFIFLTMLLLTLLGGVKWNVLNAQEIVEIPAEGATLYQTYFVPIYDYYNRHSISQTIYTQSEIGEAGLIEKIAYYNCSGNNNSRKISIYMKNIDRANFATKEWETLTSAICVYEGDHTFSTSGWSEIPLTTPFDYDGGNILVCVCDLTGSPLYSNYDTFNAYETGSTEDDSRCLYAPSLDVFEPLNHTLSANYYRNNLGGSFSYRSPAIQFTFGASEPTVKISPESIDLGAVRLGENFFTEKAFDYKNHAVTVKAQGGAVINDITTDNNFFKIVEVLTYEQDEYTFHIDYDKSANAGLQNGNLVVTYDNGQTATIPLSANAYTTTEGEAIENPIDVTFTDNAFSHTATAMHDDYILPGEETDGNLNDAVYKFTLENDAVITANVTGTNPIVAIYDEDFGEKDGPSSDNNNEGVSNEPAAPSAPTTFGPYTFDGMSLEDVFTIDDKDGDGYNWHIYSYGLYSTASLCSESYLSNGYRKLTPNNYIVTKQQYYITSNSKLQFDYQSTYVEKFAVEVSIDGESFESVWVEPNKTDSEIKTGKVSLSNYAGQSVYIALRHYDCTDGMRLLIDNLQLTDGSAKSRSVAQTRSSNQIDRVLYPAGTYYLVAAAEGGFTLNLSTSELSAPEAATLTAPENGATEQNNPMLTWTLDKFAEEYQLLLGTTNPPTDVVVDWSASATSYQTADLANNTVYYWQVKSKNSAGESSSEVFSFVTPLNKPTNVTASKTNLYPGDAVTISWTEAEGATSYNVYVGEDKVAENVTETSYDLSDLAYNMTGHNITVTANHTLGESAKSDAVVVKMTAKSKVTFTVKNAVGTPVEGASVRIYNGQDQYGVAIAEQTFTTDANGQVVEDLLYLNTYYPYYIDVIKAPYTPIEGGETMSYYYMNNPTYAKNITLQLASPTGFVAESYNIYPEQNIVLLWDEVAEATSYNVYRRGAYSYNTYDYEYELLAKGITELTYSVENSEYNMNGVYYSLEAVYSEGLSPKATLATPVKVTGNGSFTATVNVEGATIKLEGTDEFGVAQTYEILADENGEYTKEVLAGNYTATVSAFGYNDATANVTVTYNQEANSDFVMAEKPAPSEDLLRDVAVAEKYGAAEVTWTGAYNNTQMYNIYRKNVETGDIELVAENQNNTYSIGKSYTDATYSELEDGTYQYGVTTILEQNLGFTQGFEDGKLAEGWSVYSNISTTQYNWTVLNTYTYSSSYKPRTGNYAVYSKTNNTTSGRDYAIYLITPNVEWTSNSKLEFYCLNPYGSYGSSWSNTLKVMVKLSSEDNDKWQTVETYNGYATTWAKKELGEQLQSYEGKNINIAFVTNAYCSNCIVIDDIKVTGTKLQESAPVWSNEIKKGGIVFTNNDGEGDGKRETASNWSNGEVPANDGTAEVTIKAAATISSEVNVAYLAINGGSLTLNSDATLTVGELVNNDEYLFIINEGAQLFHNSDNVKASFTMNIINPEGEWNENNKTGWQFIASPFTDAFVNSFVPAYGYEYDLYRYAGNAEDEWDNHKDNYYDQSWFSFNHGEGYLASYETLTQATLSGTLNKGVTYSWDNLTYNADKNLANFHLLGNPFTFEMDITKATFTNLVEGVAIVTSDGGYDYSQTTIPVGDGFFVKTNGTNPSMYYDHNASVPVVRRGSESNNSLNIVATGKAGKDNVVINFAGASEGFDKLQNFNEDIATVYVKEDGKRYGIYNCEADVQEVALSFNANQMGSYTIAAQANGEFEMVTLVDRATGVETNLLLEDYTFAATSNDNPDRFIIRFANGQQSTVNSHFVYQSGEELILNIKGEVQIVDVLGRVVYSGEAMNDINRINVSAFNSGAYMVKVINGNEVKVEKIIL